MPERIAVQLRAEMQQLRRDMKRGMSGIRSDMERIEGQSKQINKNTQSWASSILTSAKHLASAYVTFQGIATVQDTIRWYFSSWTDELKEVESTTTRIQNAFKQVQLQTIKAGDNWQRIREEVEGTMEAFGVAPVEGWGQYETIRSVLSRFRPEERQGSMRAVSMHQALTTMDPGQLASIHARFRRMYPDMDPMRLQAMIERTIGRAPAGGERLKKFLKYQVRAGTAAKSWNVPLPAMLAMGTEMAGVTANPGRSMKHLQILWREMMANETVQPKGEGPFASLRGLEERWGQAETREELREIARNTDMSKRIIEKIPSLLERLPEMEKTYQELRETERADLRNAFDKVMKEPTSFLETIKNKTSTIAANAKAQNESMQRWTTTFSAIEDLGTWMTHKKKWIAPATAEAMVSAARTYYKITPGATRAAAMRHAMTVGDVGLTKWQQYQGIQKLQSMTTLRGKTLRAAQRLGWRGPKPPRPGAPATASGRMDPFGNAGPTVLSGREVDARAFRARVRRGYNQRSILPPQPWLERDERQQMERAAQEDTEDIKTLLREQLVNQQRRSHSSDRAGAQP